MPVVDVDKRVFNYPMSKKGINIYSNILNLDPEECIFSQNLIWKNGMVKRGGQTLDFNNTEGETSSKVVGAYRFYFGSSKIRMVAFGSDGANGTVRKDDEDNTWTDIKTGLTENLQTYFATWGALSKVFVSNETDEMWSWDGTTVTDITLADGVPLMSLPYQDRLLTIINDSNGGNLTWSDSFSDTEGDWETIADTGVRPDVKLFGMINHSLSNSETGYDAGVLLAGANGMYLFIGTDLRVPSTTGNYVIHNLVINVGCNAPRTMAWTPMGSMWLGMDRQVYLLPFGSSTPLPVGTKIQSNIDGTEGIENIPATQIQNACATYHDGFYKLSVAKQGGTNNTNQWWLDVKRLQIDEDKLYSPWYGPMVGQTIGVFANQNGPEDSGDLIGGEATAKGFIYDLHKQGDTGDITLSDKSTKTIQIFWQSYYNPIGSPDFNKTIHQIEAELLDVLGTVNIDFHDITGSVKTGDSFGLSGSAEFYDDNFYDDEFYSNSVPTRQVITTSPAINTRRLSVIVKHNISNDKFELYSVKAEALEQRKVFEGANVA